MSTMSPSASSSIASRASFSLLTECHLLLPFSHSHPFQLELEEPLSAIAMEDNSSLQEKLQVPLIRDGNCDMPVSPSCFELLAPAFAEAGEHCSLNVLPILFEDASLPVALNCPLHDRHQGQDVYSISVLPEGDEVDSKGASQLAIFSVLEVPTPSKSQMCLDTQFKYSNCVDMQRENLDAYSSCFVDIDSAKENLKVIEANEDTVGNLRTESDITHLFRVFRQKQDSLKMGGKIMQLLVNHGLTLLKLTTTDKSETDRVHDMPYNRWRRYKRAAFFDSRTVVLTFSIMSIFGTLVLIYLTLRVRQTTDTIGRA